MTAFSEGSHPRDGTGPGEVVIDGGPVELAALLDVACRGAQLRLDRAAREQMARGERALAEHLEAGRPVYGVTTGLGARVGEPLAGDTASAVETLRGRAVAVGAPLAVDVVRAAMVTRAAGLATGGSGASPAVAEHLIALLNAGVHPIVPGTGSLGASDLCLLAHVGLVLIGEGEAEHRGTRLTGAAALRAAGLPVLVPAPRDGLAICSSSAVSVGAAALALAEAQSLLAAAQAAAALSFEAFRANPGPLAPGVVGARPAPGQTWASQGLRALLAGGELMEPAGPRRLQDPLSLRAVATLHGALAVALERLQDAVLPELGAAADSPLVIGGEVVSTANFHSPALSQALDAAAIALAQAGDAAAARPARLAASRFSGLPEGLAGGPHASGVAPLEKTARALARELVLLAAPRSLDAAVAADGAEDAVTGALPGALRLREAVAAMTRLIAVELTVAATALTLRGPLRLGGGTAELLAWVRARGDLRAGPGSIGAGLESMAQAIAAGELTGLGGERWSAAGGLTGLGGER
ncbi:MAG TPA: aromatic amino acid lyase [Solirubrobacteraceae bacterium]|nr:aromatic amino acid lyase [Solirubrobacteraceae bacterium]